MNVFNSLFVLSLILSGGIGAVIGLVVARGVGFGDYSFLTAAVCGVVGIVTTARWWAKRPK